MKSIKTSQLYKWMTVMMVSIAMLGASQPVTAQEGANEGCEEFISQSSGNLFGYIIASELPSDDQQNYIWMNSEDDPWDGGPSYGVTYDRNTGIFSGRGWNEGLRVWVDFDMGSSDEAQVLDAEGNPIGGFQWGYWDGEIKGLDNLIYSNNQGGLVPQGTQNADIDGDGNTDFTYTWPYDAQYVSGDSQDDVIVGMGELSFDEVVFGTSSIPNECQEYVDVLANGRSSLHMNECGQEVELTWNTQNIAPGSCETVNNGAPWSSQGARPEVELSGENAGPITEDNSPVYFTLECTGAISGNQVRGLAQVSCGEVVPTGTSNNFEFIES